MRTFQIKLKTSEQISKMSELQENTNSSENCLLSFMNFLKSRITEYSMNKDFFSYDGHSEMFGILPVFHAQRPSRLIFKIPKDLWSNTGSYEIFFEYMHPISGKFHKLSRCKDHDSEKTSFQTSLLTITSGSEYYKRFIVEYNFLYNHCPCNHHCDYPSTVPSLYRCVLTHITGPYVKSTEVYFLIDRMDLSSHLSVFHRSLISKN